VAQIKTVTSEALQAELRRLLPSQQGFGEDLEALNVIIPIIDLTNAAEGSAVGENLQTAINFGGATTFDVTNTTTTVVSTTGFFRIIGNVTGVRSSANNTASININDTSSTKEVYAVYIDGGSSGGGNPISVNVDFVVFLRSTDTLEVQTNAAEIRFKGSTRQIADINGNLVNPVGFNPQ
jgi:hypothetical protein